MLKILGMLLAILLLLTFSVKMCMAEAPLVFHWNAPREVYAAKIDRFLVSYFAKCAPSKLANARRVVPTVLDISEEMGVNPAIVSGIITRESTWQPTARGKLGEVGLMQVNNVASNDDPAVQLRIGIGILKDAFAKCGTIEGAISLYATGKSCKVYRGAKYRIRTAQQIEAM